MSTEAMRTVLRADVSDPSLKAVLLGLAEHAGPTGENCYPSVARLVAYTNLSEATVRTKLAQARTAELLEVSRKAAQHRPTEYRMNLAMLERMVHKNILVLEGAETATYSGIQTSSSHRSGKRQTSSSRTPDLQQPESRPPAAGPKPSFNQEATSSRPPAARPPAVELHRRLVHRYFHKSTWPTIARVVGSDFSALLRWGRIVRAWKLADHNVTNAEDLLDVFRNGWRPNGVAGRRDPGYSAAADVADFNAKRAEARAALGKQA